MANPFVVNLVPVALTTATAALATAISGKLGWWSVSSRLVVIVSSVAATVSAVANNLLSKFNRVPLTAADKAVNTFVALGAGVTGVLAGLGVYKYLYTSPVGGLFNFRTVATFTALVAISRFASDALARPAV